MPGNPKQLFVKQVRFLGAQDGPPESVLKNRLVQFFQSEKDIERAYLVRTDFGDGTPITVALGIRMRGGNPKDITDNIGEIFAQIFGSREHLDIIFVDDRLEETLAKSCRPFYSVVRDT